MELGQRLCLDRLDFAIDAKKEVTDEALAMVVHLTAEFQTKLGLSQCVKLSPDGFAILKECHALRALDLSGTHVEDVGFLYTLEELRDVCLARCASIEAVSALLGCQKLLRVNLRSVVRHTHTHTRIHKYAMYTTTAPAVVIDRSTSATPRMMRGRSVRARARRVISRLSPRHRPVA